MKSYPFNATGVFSPSNEQFILAEHGEMSEDFTVVSKLMICRPGFEET